jgi:hypothetical protein
MKAKNPYAGYPEERIWKSGYTAGIPEGEKRLARAFMRWIGFNTNVEQPDYDAMKDFLAARMKKR